MTRRNDKEPSDIPGLFEVRRDWHGHYEHGTANNINWIGSFSRTDGQDKKYFGAKKKLLEFVSRKSAKSMEAIV